MDNEKKRQKEIVRYPKINKTREKGCKGKDIQGILWEKRPLDVNNALADLQSMYGDAPYLNSKP